MANHTELRMLLLIALIIMLCGCVRLTGIEHSVQGGLSRDYSGGEVFSASPSGHKEQGGSWFVGTKIKTIWTR